MRMLVLPLMGVGVDMECKNHRSAGSSGGTYKSLMYSSFYTAVHLFTTSNNNNEYPEEKVTGCARGAILCTYGISSFYSYSEMRSL